MIIPNPLCMSGEAKDIILKDMARSAVSSVLLILPKALWLIEFEDGIRITGSKDHSGGPDIRAAVDGGVLPMIRTPDCVRFFSTPNQFPFPCCTALAHVLEF